MTLTPEGYRPRLAESELDLMMRAFGAVSIEGPKFCGKTWLSRTRANSEISLNDPAGQYAMRRMVEMDIMSAYDGEEPRLIDEWQEVPAIWSATKDVVDSSTRNGRFILSGSSTPLPSSKKHSGAGRLGRMRIRTMSLYESGDSSGQVSLEGLFDDKVKAAVCRTELSELVRLAVRGGWPRNIEFDESEALIANRGYLRTIVEDAARLDGKSRNSRKIEMLLRSLARNESTYASKASIAKDIREYENEDVSDTSITNYLDLLDRMYLINDQLPFDPNYRSSVRVGSTQKRHLADPSLAVAALDLNSLKLIEDLRTFGFIFESMCARDLDVYASRLGGRLLQYRDDKDREIDAVVELPDGRWGAFEIKLGAQQIDGAAANLIRIRDYMADRGAKVPSVLCVVCGLSQAVYRRDDGVFVVPITALRP